MPPVRKAAHVPTPTRQASIGNYFTKISGPSPPSFSKSRLPKWVPAPEEPNQVGTRAKPKKTEVILVDDSDTSSNTSSVTSSDESSEGEGPPVFPTYPVVEGEYWADFGDDRTTWDDRYYKIIGTRTQTITLGTSFVVTDMHLSQIAALDAEICKSITSFTFYHADVSYDAHNSARDVSDSGIIRLAEGGPNLSYFSLPNVGSGVSDVSLCALFSACPKISYIEVSGTSFTDDAFEVLLENPEWVPNLQVLRISNIARDKQAMKSLRELGKARPELRMELIEKTQEKRWGDWEMVTTVHVYRGGRKR